MRFEIIFQIIIYGLNIAIFCFKEVLSQEYCNTNPENIKKRDCENTQETITGYKPVCEEFDGMWYLVVAQCMYYKKAKKHCEDLGFKMSNIRSLKQFQWLASKACTDTDLFWAGPYRVGEVKSNPTNADNSNLPKKANERDVPDNPYWAHGHPSGHYRCFVFGYKNRKTMTTWKCLDGAKFFCETKTPACGFKVDGKMSKWSEWSECSQTCGAGEKTRSRKCTPPLRGGKPCAPDTTGTKKCLTVECAKNGSAEVIQEGSTEVIQEGSTEVIQDNTRTTSIIMAKMKGYSNKWGFIVAALVGCLLLMGILVAISIYRTKSKENKMEP